MPTWYPQGMELRTIGETGPVIDLGDGFYLPEWFKVLMDDDEYPATVEIAGSVEDGQPVLVSVKVERRPSGPALSAGDLAAIRVGDLFRLAATSVSYSARATQASPVWLGTVENVLARPVLGAADHVVDEAWRRLAPRRTHRVDDALLSEVATIYRENLGSGAPTEAVREKKSVSHSTAARWVGLARKRGFLGQAMGSGAAGEQPKQQKESKKADKSERKP